jgi:hypothetical protein
MLTLLTQLSRGPEISCTALPRRMRGQLGLRNRPRPPGASSWPLPLLRLGAGERPARESQLGRSVRAPAAGIVARDLDPQLACVLVVLESRDQQRRVARRPMPHSAADHLERRKGQSRSVHVGRHTSRLKPRTSSGRVINSSPFSLVRGDANQRRETPENPTLGPLLSTI